MNSTEKRRFLGHWCRIAVLDALAHVFGWPTLVSAVVLAYFLPRLGFEAIANPVANNFASALVSFVLAFIVYVIRALFKAYRLLRPLVVTVTDDIRSLDMDFSEKFRGHNVTVIVRNRSGAYLKDCVAYVMNAPCGDGSIFPRFVEKFDLPPECQKNVCVAYWYSRELPNIDDKEIGLPGPSGAGFGGNVCRLPGSEAVLQIKIQAQNIDSKDIQCRVWIEQTSRRLRGMQLLD